MYRIIKIGINSDPDVVILRQRARQISSLLGFGTQDQVRIATAVSELSRQVCRHKTNGFAEFGLEDNMPGTTLIIKIKNIAGDRREASTISTTGLPDALPNNGFEEALISAHRLMDACEVNHDSDQILTVTLRKRLPATIQLTQSKFAELSERLASSPLINTYSEVQLQNQELLTTLAELREKQDDLLALTQELEDTNRGVVALYAEIEEKAERLRTADELKSRFLSNTSHELRTPLSSIRALSRLLLDRIDGDLTVEQEKQVGFIAKAANDLSELVNDLLDLAKIESGKIDINCTPFSVANLFSALRGMMRPLVFDSKVEFIIEDPPATLEMYSDEGKVAQILRNFLSNALKFTEQGEVRMSVHEDNENQFLRFTVSDTGIGIAPENIQLVFEEFSQIENPLQKKAKGTGLGLPLCRKLAALLGGRVEMTSKEGVGSAFSLLLPTRYVATTKKDAWSDFAPARGHHG